MKTNKIFKILILLVLLAMTATTVLASSPFAIESFWMEDPLDPGHTAPPAGTDPATPWEGWWWRDTTNQNAIANHSSDDYTGTAYKVYDAAGLTVMVYSSTNGPNVVALVTSSELLLIGAGGSVHGANYAKIAFQKAYSGFMGKHLRGIVLLDPSRESSWGTNYWRALFGPFPLIINAAYPGVKARWDRVGSEMNRRQNAVYGNAVTSTSLLWGWGDDYFLGAGSMEQYTPILASYAPPGASDIYVTSQVYSSMADCGSNMCWHTGGVTGLELSLSGIPVDILATSDQDAGLLVDLPHQQIVISRDGGKFLPDVGSLYKPVVTVGERIKELNWSLYGSKGAFSSDPGTWELSTATNTVILIPAYGLPISGVETVNAALTAQRSALKYLHDQTVQQINLGTPLEEIVATVQLPSDLAASPYNQEFTSTTAYIIRSVYQEYMGWFGGEPDEMAGSLSPGAKAQILADALGGVSALASAARQAELDARDLAGAEKALYLAHSAYLLAPDDFTVKEVYAQTLRKIAYMQKSAQVRNYYLSLAHGLGTEQVVTSFLKSGDEDIPVAFTAAEFSQHFSGISGATLGWIKITSLPQNGELILASVPVTITQEIPLADLGGLVFTPAPDWNGDTSFTWNGKDGGNYCANDATVTITVNPVNDPPAVSDPPLADITVDEDAANSVIDLSPGFSDVDFATNSDALTFIAASSNTSLVTTSVIGSTLTLDYQPDQNGTTTITVTATDTAGASVTDEIIITVNPFNDAPTAADASITVIAGKSQTITLDYGDLETSQANLQVDFGAPAGTLDASALPALTYTAPTTPGDDSFTYTVTDRGDPDGCSIAPCAGPLSVTANITVTVLPAPSGSINGTIFNDANANGVLEAGEAGLAGVIVQLQDGNGSLLETFTTGEDGAYAFTGLNAGSYLVYAPKSTNRVQTTDNPIAVSLATSAEVKTGVNIGSVVSADLSVSMTASVNGKQIIYAITVTNTGPAQALNAILTDLLPDGTSYLTVIATQGSCSGGKTVNCSFGAIASGGSVTVTLKVNRTNTKIAIVNTATAASSVFDIYLTNNSATVTTP